MINDLDLLVRDNSKLNQQLDFSSKQLKEFKDKQYQSSQHMGSLKIQLEQNQEESQDILQKYH